MLIDETYFVGAINIPNTDKIAVLERLTYFIEKYEPELLKALLGYGLWKLWEVDPEEVPFDGITLGAEYTDYAGRLQKWQGLTITDGTDSPYSLIAYYIYYHWMRDQASQTTGIGEVKSKGENSDPASPVLKMVNAWNEMSAWIYDLTTFLNRSQETFPEWDPALYCRIRDQFRPINRFDL
jgi:hypothetical protein